MNLDLAFGYLSVYIPLVCNWLCLVTLGVFGVSWLFRLFNRFFLPKDKEQGF